MRKIGIFYSFAWIFSGGQICTRLKEMQRYKQEERAWIDSWSFLEGSNQFAIIKFKRSEQAVVMRDELNLLYFCSDAIDPVQLDVAPDELSDWRVRCDHLLHLRTQHKQPYQSRLLVASQVHISLLRLLEGAEQDSFVHLALPE
jgi:hypothetical protein